ncbi:MAG TPA: carbohydrate ABC transporter permease [Anaerolineaceae bacterium]
MKRGKVLKFVVMLLFTLLALALIYAPVAWLVISSIATRNDLLTVPLRWIPEHANIQNYIDILIPGTDVSSVAATFKVTLKNSIVVATSTTLICLVAGSLAAYALARLEIPFRRFMLMGVMSTRMIPEVSLVIPLYILASRAGLMDSPIILILTYLSFALPFAIWMLAAFFEAVPFELEDAALIDGASRWGILFKVILPVSTPGLVSTALFTFLLAWDEFFFALIFTSTLAAKTVPVAIAEFTGRYAVDITGMMTGGVLAALPPVILSLIFQRYIVSGLTAGAVKG